MFEKMLTDKLKRIFDLKKVTLDAPGESAEQDTLFVEVETSRNTVKDGRWIARASGRIRIFSQNTKLPFGFFSKRLAEADSEDTIDFFFFDMEENSGRFLNLVERSASFVFFFSGQYNPEVGTMNELNIQEQVSE